MKKASWHGFICGAALLLLSGCMTGNPGFQQTLQPSDLTPAQGVVVVGIRLVNNFPNALGFKSGPFGEWIQYDPTTKLRIGTTEIDLDVGSGILLAPELKAGGTAYRFYKLPPGNYALATLEYLQSDKSSAHFMFVAGKMTEINGSIPPHIVIAPDVQLQTYAPRFSVGANEVVYVGTLVFDMGLLDEVRWSLERDENAARAAVAQTNPSMAQEMIVRSMTRANGTPIGAPDAAKGAITNR